MYRDDGTTHFKQKCEPERLRACWDGALAQAGWAERRVAVDEFNRGSRCGFGFASRMLASECAPGAARQLNVFTLSACCEPLAHVLLASTMHECEPRHCQALRMLAWASSELFARCAGTASAASLCWAPSLASRSRSSR